MVTLFLKGVKSSCVCFLQCTNDHRISDICLCSIIVIGKRRISDKDCDEIEAKTMMIDLFSLDQIVARRQYDLLSFMLLVRTHRTEFILILYHMTKLSIRLSCPLTLAKMRALVPSRVCAIGEGEERKTSDFTVVFHRRN